jgi:hypothetical protein
MSKRRNWRSSSRPNRTRNRKPKARATRTAAWTDPVSPVSKMTKSKKKKTNKQDWSKSCWWFG